MGLLRKYKKDTLKEINMEDKAAEKGAKKKTTDEKADDLVLKYYEPFEEDKLNAQMEQIGVGTLS